ncbi:hypothetical protein GCK72_026071 [Caenorhabditis remanei]|uniref:RecF/RecN/SMC N-terminal domain-containing protein n=1 Tax=Caenorhabditis remanei TaxID=31234 RepID=A0A6A5G471_CAERE|nr:hypothetical protein GCK72_026071 [Caenorhabditis remanei]KAF1749603.1 hypothetical protein GCK72_026071 [Caenorhabditis remanei]
MSVQCIVQVSVLGVRHVLDQTLEFENGLNAIEGYNGSGKTTLLKAIKYCLNYIPDDSLVRRDSSVAVKFRLTNGLYRTYRKLTGDAEDEELKPYSINGNKVSDTEYVVDLNNVGINNHTVHFMIPEFDWKEMARKDNWQLALLIENLSPELEDIKYDFEEVQEKLRRRSGKEKDEEFDRLQRQLEEVKTRRRTTFLESFDALATQVDRYYKMVTGDQNVKAELKIVNPAEPYEEVEFLISSKHGTIDTLALSFGEISFVSTALMFAFQHALQTPFVILDRFDVSFSGTSCIKVSRGLVEIMEATGLQISVICHKDMMGEVVVNVIHLKGKE